jgi:hypothetical protein
MVLRLEGELRVNNAAVTKRRLFSLKEECGWKKIIVIAEKGFLACNNIACIAFDDGHASTSSNAIHWLGHL